MTPTAYSDAMFPEGRTVFGVPLLPLCIGQALLLHRLRSPLVCSGGLRPPAATDGGHRPPLQLPGLGDLLLALEICRKPGAQLPSRARMKWLGLQQLRFTELQKLRLEGRYLDGIRDFREYWHDAFTHWPGVWAPKDAPRDSGVPLLAGLKCRLMAWLHVSEEQALATPIARARWDIAAHAAMEGNLQLRTAEEEALIEAGKRGGGTVITVEGGAPDSDPAAASNAGSESGAPTALALAALAQLRTRNPKLGTGSHG